MSASSKRERQQRKRRKKKARAAEARKKLNARLTQSGCNEDEDAEMEWGESDTASSPREFFLDSLSTITDPLPGIPTSERPRLKTAADIWWDRYAEADGAARVRMTRAKLEALSPDDEEYEQFFPEAICELESVLSPGDYVAFLEELIEAHPTTYALQADWHTCSLVFEYLAQDRREDVERAALHLAGDLQKVGEPFFSLISALRLAGLASACEALLDAAVNRLATSDLMPWACAEILEWAMFVHYQKCVAADVSEDAIEALHSAVQELGVADDEESRARRRAFALHLAGKSGKQWNKEELVGRKQSATRNIFLLGADYQRWLCDSRGLEAIVADELRIRIMDAINGMDCPFGRMLKRLPRIEFDRYLAGKLGFMSLDRIAAPAAIIAIKHFYDFLREVELVGASSWQESQSVCDGLWNDLKRAMDDEEWRIYQFLEKYQPSQPTSDDLDR